MELNIFEETYKLINSYNRKTAKPKQYGTDDLLYPAEVHILDVIGNHENATVTELAEMFGITKGAVSQTISKLTQKQLVEKTPSGSEKNVVHISLSEKGRAVYEYHRNMHSEVKKKIDGIIGSLSPEGLSAFKEIISIFDDMLENM